GSQRKNDQPDEDDSDRRPPFFSILGRSTVRSRRHHLSITPAT
ncbi:MAG: hypothetical protein ACI944_001401, partial [Natronomonas sp.]